MVVLALRSLSSPDVTPDAWMPENNRAFFLLQLEVGAVGSAAADTFDVVIATPEGLAHIAPEDGTGAISKRATIVLREFTWARVHATISQILRDCQSSTWTESVQRLQRYFAWEFEDYVLEN